MKKKKLWEKIEQMIWSLMNLQIQYFHFTKEIDLGAQIKHA